MVISKLHKEQITSPICVYRMYEHHYSTRKECKYSIEKHINGKKYKQVVIPVTKATAEAVWKELKENDWKC